MFKRIFLMFGVNILIIVTISIIYSVITSALGIDPYYLSSYGINYESLAIFCLFWGMGGAFISLLISKMMAKWMMGVQIIDPNQSSPEELRVYQSVQALAKQAGIGMPEVGIYQSPEVNAFATGASRDHALVAVSSGLLQRMNADELEGVLGHEVSHIANGDMITMTLLQGVVNAFVMFFARILAFVISQRGRQEENNSFGQHMLVFVFEILFGILGSILVAYFSRWREYRADAGSAKIAGTGNMIQALEALKKTFEIQDPAKQETAFASLKISGRPGWLSLFATHPSLDDRIAKLKGM